MLRWQWKSIRVRWNHRCKLIASFDLFGWRSTHSDVMLHVFEFQIQMHEKHWWFSLWLQTELEDEVRNFGPAHSYLNQLDSQAANMPPLPSLPSYSSGLSSVHPSLSPQSPQSPVTPTSPTRGQSENRVHWAETPKSRDAKSFHSIESEDSSVTSSDAPSEKETRFVVHMILSRWKLLHYNSACCYLQQNYWGIISKLYFSFVLVSQ